MPRTIRSIVLAGLITACAGYSSAQEAREARADSTAPAATVESYWGPIPVGDPSSRGSYGSRKAHPVEHVILAPFYAVTYPIFLVTRGLKAGLVFMDERGILPGSGPALPIRIGQVVAGPTVTYGGHSGFGGGATILVVGDRKPADWIKLRYTTTVKGMHRATAGLRAPLGERANVELGGGYRLERNARFFGLGPTSSVDDQSFYTQEQYWAGAGYRRELKGPLDAEWKAVYTSIATRGPRAEDTPDLGVQFAASPPPGYGDRSDGVLLNTLLRLDTTNETGRPASGVIMQGQAGYFGPTGGQEDAFWRFSGEAGTFLPLWFTDRTLAIRGAVTWIDEAPGSSTVPFTRLATNYEGGSLRGYRDYRWRDRGLLDLSAEYRWPVWALDRPHGIGADAYGFINSGQVFKEWNQITTHLWRTSWGGGFRAITKGGFGGRLEIAHSNESTEIRIQADQMFDFKEMGLFGGSDRVGQAD